MEIEIDTVDTNVITALVTASAAILGAAVGGFLSWWATYSLQRGRWAREDQTRFHETRRISYAQFFKIIN